MRLPRLMQAMHFVRPGRPLCPVEVPVPRPGPGELLLRVSACGVCRTDLHIVNGDLPAPKLPLILGHEIVGHVVALGDDVRAHRIGDRVGVPWLGGTDGTCRYCRRGSENLCIAPRFTGYTIDGGYAEYAVADSRFSFSIPRGYDDAHAAPLLCAGLIGFRAYRMTGEARRLGLYGFGAAAHILSQVACADGREVYAFTRPGDHVGQAFARALGVAWAGDSTQLPPTPLDAAIIFAPAGALVPAALRAVDKGGVVVCAGIHMTDIPAFPYRLLWEERTVRSVANLTREDGKAFMDVAARTPIDTRVQLFSLEEANRALACLREGTIVGAAVLSVARLETESDAPPSVLR